MVLKRVHALDTYVQLSSRSPGASRLMTATLGWCDTSFLVHFCAPNETSKRADSMYRIAIFCSKTIV